MPPKLRAEADTLLSTLTTDLSPETPFIVSGTEYDGQQAKAALVTKMIDGLAGAAQRNEMQATAAVDLYFDAIDDLPAWAIDLAIKRWAQGKCPASIEDRPRYAWPPAPATLRQMAELELSTIRLEHRLVKNLVAAIPFEKAMDPKPLAIGAGGRALPALRRM